jgi:hypothetical protein
VSTTGMSTESIATMLQSGSFLSDIDAIAAADDNRRYLDVEV